LILLSIGSDDEGEDVGLSFYSSINDELNKISWKTRFMYNKCMGYIEFPITLNVPDNILTLNNGKLNNIVNYIKWSPNPFQSKTILSLSLNECSFISIELYSLSNKASRSLILNKHKCNNKFEFVLDDKSIKPGIYNCLILIESQKNSFIVNRKIIKL